MRRLSLPVLAGAVLVAAPVAHAQVTAASVPPVPPIPPLEVGAMAPDFAIPGATRYGVLQSPVRLSDYRGKTVVLAFFFRARTRG